jgi:membrane protein implicated in regulation of membrane protease activity
MTSLLDLVTTLGVWSWFAAAAVLILLEFVVPGVHFLWFGLSAAIVGLLALATGVGWQLQIAAFAAISIAAVLAVRRFAEPDVARSDQPQLNIRGQQYIGRVLTVEDAIQGGRGRVRVGDTLWAAQGTDAPRGAKVRVTGVDGTVLVVEGV